MDDRRQASSIGVRSFNNTTVVANNYMIKTTRLVDNPQWLIQLIPMQSN